MPFPPESGCSTIALRRQTRSPLSTENDNALTSTTTVKALFGQNNDLAMPAVYAEEEETGCQPEIIPNAEYFERYLAECYNEVLVSGSYELNQRSHPLGDEQLRKELADFLFRFHSISADPEQIIVSSGIESLMFNILNLPSVINPSGQRTKGLLSRAERFHDFIRPRAAVSEGTSDATKKLFTDADIQVKEVATDDQGISFNSLLTSGTTLLYVTPFDVPEYSLEDPAERQQELLDWADSASYRYIIEYDASPEVSALPTFKSKDRHDKVIYLNSFSSLLCKGISASWTVLPKKVCEEYKAHFEKFNCQLSYLEQLVLTLFLRKRYLDNYLESIQQIQAD